MTCDLSPVNTDADERSFDDAVRHCAHRQASLLESLGLRHQAHPIRRFAARTEARAAE